ncbi:reverse transcriptase-like protein [Thermaerobacter sp. PB12/4term]|uniref:tRNA (adenine(22)-N(1))-methyltransferase TrmK n=1 Tax=Thermaerobacter sp. PB12/4term TaxID=2293838 RepID=UPI000E32C933|nr:tRNA (adenine(22)-N(1))-methyltransferase TrmK [Thermaerobacter sp. PB12/4term]QIA27849.1 reverse transcriptase-like protein [Thermaerobacter sp. PB12/4term]
MTARRLGPRLEALLDMLGRVEVLADIGTDHGLLPVTAVLRGRARRAIATDLRAAPLAAARRLVEDTGTQDRIELRQGPGLLPLRPGEAGTVVISGLHGETIAAILRAGAGRLEPGTRLLLQPTRGAAALRLPALDRRTGRLWMERLWLGVAPAMAAPTTGPEVPAEAETAGPPGACGPCAPQAGPAGAGITGVAPSGQGPDDGAPARPGREGPPRCLFLDLEEERVVVEGRHAYVIIAGRVVEPPFHLPVGWPVLAITNPSGPEDAAPDERPFIWLWDAPVVEAAHRLAGLALRWGVDPGEAVGRVGPALLAHPARSLGARGAGPGAGPAQGVTGPPAAGRAGPWLACWLHELARPWRKALRANTGSTSRAVLRRSEAAAWLGFLGEVLALEAGNMAPDQDASPPAGTPAGGEGLDRTEAAAAAPWRLHTDGAARGNPGPAGIGVVLVGPDGAVAERIARFIGEATNNVAEYTALVTGLQRALERGARRLDVYSDSELMVRQLNGQYRVKNEGLKPLFEQAARLAAQFELVRFIHVPRERNREADRLANQGIDQGTGGAQGAPGPV